GIDSASKLVEQAFGSVSGHYIGNGGLFSWDPIYPKATPVIYKPGDPADTTAKVKRAAKYCGAADVGVCELNPRWVYSNEGGPENRPMVFEDGYDKPKFLKDKVVIPSSYKYAVVMVVPCTEEGMKCCPNALGSGSTHRAYSDMAIAAGRLATFIRDLGFGAIPMGNDTSLSTPLAIDAGLGEPCRNSLLINPTYGSAIRICKVFTDLPLVPDKPIKFGVEQFCKVCRKCAKACPIQALTLEKEKTWEGPTTSANNHGVLKWYMNPEKCWDFWEANGCCCCVCIHVCPFNKPHNKWYHRSTKWFIKHMPSLNSFWVKLDDAMGYGKQQPAEDFWRSDKYVPA
ncbi:MAG: reductive dehalogenase, partial [Candidatus Bathyarchaeota archaeon]